MFLLGRAFAPCRSATGRYDARRPALFPATHTPFFPPESAYLPEIHRPTTLVLFVIPIITSAGHSSIELDLMDETGGYVAMVGFIGGQYTYF